MTVALGLKTAGFRYLTREQLSAKSHPPLSVLNN